MDDNYEVTSLSGIRHVMLSVSQQKLSLSYWTNLVESYFTPTSVTKLTLWKDQGNEAKPFGATGYIYDPRASH
jgi:hypothetical protein